MRSTENISPVGRQGARSAEGTVVEEADAGVELPEAEQGVAEGGVGWGEIAYACAGKVSRCDTATS